MRANDRGGRYGYDRWVEEFTHELVTEQARLLEARRHRAGTPWRFETAVAASRAFFRERFIGYATCHSITPAQRDRLLALVTCLGTDTFPATARETLARVLACPSTK